MTTPIQDTILSQLAGLPAGKSIDPMSVAKAIQPERWQRLLGHIRTDAVELAKEGKIVILRHNKPANPEKFRGVYRLRLPMEGDPTSFPDDVEDGADDVADGAED
ncbi:DUF3253 domain-containing protein [Caulobacter sp. CCNWLY153]|uniref:DUF3253 domain-containing protein n=1 Tax=unclassified Caulobacter TaxID=2648921 RepID=UPI002FF15B4E